MSGHTIAMRQEMTLQLALLRERFMRAMASLPSAVISRSSRPFNRDQMLRDKVDLQLGRIFKGGTTHSSYAVGSGVPATDALIIGEAVDIWNGNL